MINKEERRKILDLFVIKEEKIFAGYIIDCINKFEINNYIIHTNFLNLNEKSIASRILNKFNIKYNIVSLFSTSEKTVIFLIPDYIETDKIDLNEFLTVLKIVPSVKSKLTHKKYMGTLYSLGIRENLIGDIILNDDICYVSLIKDIEEYIYNNLFSVAKVEVKIFSLDINDKSLYKIKTNFKSKDILISSLRVDVILASLYKLSRNEVKKKIAEGDLIVNSKEMFFVSYVVCENDIISFRTYGKFRVGQVLGSTKSGKMYLNVKEYS